ncbi:hypothetical protein K402DRAFT_468015 [Aulographum hederae CBS 113979]|uniref:Uncharacterized protein n=1 Tax=Aulographum hederae CBS 113979 TaxID=1176131 RepID=A0A6G1GJ96_9PEZI|nr:hypothetical protein K402DRAFT_468015 [Aulographum hederae CBS 113979]
MVFKSTRMMDSIINPRDGDCGGSHLASSAQTRLHVPLRRRGPPPASPPWQATAAVSVIPEAHTSEAITVVSSAPTHAVNASIATTEPPASVSLSVAATEPVSQTGSRNSGLLLSRWAPRSRSVAPVQTSCPPSATVQAIQDVPAIDDEVPVATSEPVINEHWSSRRTTSPTRLRTMALLPAPLPPPRRNLLQARYFDGPVSGDDAEDDEASFARSMQELTDDLANWGLDGTSEENQTQRQTVSTEREMAAVNDCYKQTDRVAYFEKEYEPLYIYNGPGKTSKPVFKPQDSPHGLESRVEGA